MKTKEKQNLLWPTTLAILFIFWFQVVTSQGQTIIENPEKPLNKNAGRVIHLKEILRIKDEGKDFYFKIPWQIDIAPEGSIFVKDGVKLYKFNASGNFEKNIVKIGQGPGEMTTELTDFIVVEDEIILLCGSMNKLIKTDLNGEWIEEFFPKHKRALDLLAYYSNKYFLLDFRRKSFERKEGIQDFNQSLYIMDEDENITLTPFSFPIKQSINIRIREGSRPAISSIYVTRLYRSKACQQYIYLAHTQDYLIKQLDLEKFQISRIFRRKYPRARFQADKRRPFKHYNDVYRLLIHKSNVWALTSTFDEKKGILVDVFNEEGKYLDNFFLPLFNSKTGDEFSQLYFPLVMQGDFLYTIEHDEDWNFYVVKYEIIDEG
jgi:hypothetical protein